MASSMIGYGLTRILYLLVLGISLATGSVAAETQKWDPPSPSKSEKDWILLSSGEWLWGTIELMRDESLEFDSEELDNVTIDWEKIVEIRSSRILTYALRNGAVITGTSTLKGDVLLIKSSSGVTEVPRTRIYTILEGEPTELNYWSAKIEANVNIRTGNTNQFDLGTRVFLKREAARSRIDLRYQANISERDNTKTVDDQRINGEWKVFLSRLFFVTPVKSEIYQDTFQNIHRQYTIGPGVGYYITRSSKADWYVEFTAASQGTEYISVLEGEANNEANFSLPMRTSLELDLTSRIELHTEYSLQYGIGENDNSIHRAFILFKIELLGDTDFNASMTWDRVTRPKTNADGITPDKDDVALAYGISIKF